MGYHVGEDYGLPHVTTYYSTFYFTASFNAFPGRNFTTFDAGIVIISPVRGLRPLRALRDSTESVANPVKVNLPSLANTSSILINVAFNVRSAAALVILTLDAIWATRSAFVIILLLFRLI
ncbi:NA [Lawsonia intracellularis PHE/MN1-00]|uniref:NA n=1 Tax=Lawsonia intracellularis (strain PHE/MN1-00) TaxID=363253 RepID=Q1MR02_LAWIP|nr:NA [Lawsonia intracellularis PHE/MN1-00]